MSDLFLDLYRYRQREKKENQEDWLTECLAAVFRSLSAEKLVLVLHEITKQPLGSIRPHCEKITIETQKVIDVYDGQGTQRPDLLISIGSRPWLLFENKVFHSIGGDRGEFSETQLHRYGRWLKRQDFSFDGICPALVFVTHGTLVPAEFPDPNCLHPAYAGLRRCSSTWAHLARILHRATNDLDEAFHARALVKAFTNYLEHHGMLSDYPGYSDLAGLSFFVERADVFSKLVNEMFDRLKNVAPFSGRARWSYPDSDIGTFGCYRYLAGEARFDDCTFISTGIWFPEKGDGWYGTDIAEKLGVPVSPSPKVFIQLANEEDDALSNLQGIPGAGWHRPQSDFFIFRDFAAFPGEPTERANAIFAWLDAECSNLQAFLKEK